MSSTWNGLNLQTELSQALCDTSTSFKAKVLEWMNEIQEDIYTRHQWPFAFFKGGKVLTIGNDEQELNLDQPTAPTAAIATGGNLAESSTYSVLVTYYESVSKVESLAGLVSGTVTATATDKTVSLTGIPVSSDPLVTARRVYLSKDSGEYYLSSTISDNTSTTLSIASDTSSTEEAPDQKAIFFLQGNPFISGQRQLQRASFDQIRLLYTTFQNGTPEMWAPLNEGRIMVYNPPSSADTLNFYYFKRPSKIFANTTRDMDMPSWLKPVLRAGVLALGYEYRDRSGQDGKRQNYEALLVDAINRKGGSPKTRARVRDVVGDTRGRAN